MENSNAAKFDAADGTQVEQDLERAIIGNKTANLASDVFLWAALGATAASVTLKCFGKKDSAWFTGLMAAPLLLLSVYDKIGKPDGQEKQSEDDK